MGRLDNLDSIRGIALMLIVVLHCSIYNFANIHKIDFSSPPLIVVIMSFLGLWGGLLIMYSGAVNTYMTVKRAEARTAKEGIDYTKYMIIAGCAYLLLHFVEIFALGRWTIDFVNNEPHRTLVANVLRSMSFSLPPADILLQGSVLSTIGFNLLLLGLLFKGLSKTPFVNKPQAPIILAVSGAAVVLASFVRVQLFTNLPQGLLFSFFMANPYPVITYLGYGLIGSALGLMIAHGHAGLIKKLMLPLAVGFLALGLYLMSQFPRSISKPDMFWYAKTLMELGVFMLMLSGAALAKRLRLPAFMRDFSRVSLTVYLGETLLSELLIKVVERISPAWNQTINGSLLFGGLNLLVWIVLLALWRKSGFRYSLEWWWVRLFKGLGKESTKLGLE